MKNEFPNHAPTQIIHELAHNWHNIKNDPINIQQYINQPKGGDKARFDSDMTILKNKVQPNYTLEN